MTTTSDLPQTQKALVQVKYGEPLELQSIAVPQPGPGSVTVQILSNPVLSYAKNVYNGVRKYPYPTPLVPGASAVGRIAATGPDTTSLSVGQLVNVDCFIHARDEPSTAFLLGVHEGYSPGSQALMRGEWRNSNQA